MSGRKPTKHSNPGDPPKLKQKRSKPKEAMSDVLDNYHMPDAPITSRQIINQPILSEINEPERKAIIVSPNPESAVYKADSFQIIVRSSKGTKCSECLRQYVDALKMNDLELSYFCALLGYIYPEEAKATFQAQVAALVVAKVKSKLNRIIN